MNYEAAKEALVQGNRVTREALNGTYLFSPIDESPDEAKMLERRATSPSLNDPTLKNSRAAFGRYIFLYMAEGMPLGLFSPTKADLAAEDWAIKAP